MNNTMLKKLSYVPSEAAVANFKGVAPEDRRLFDTFMNPGQRRNLADLITAKLTAHENRVHFDDEPSEPRPRPLPPKVVEVYKKSSPQESKLTPESAFFSRDTSLENSPKHSKLSLLHGIGRLF